MLCVQATVCAKYGLECVVYMGAKDMERQKLNVFRMRLLGAEVRPVTSGTATLKDATSEAIRDWVTNVESTHYILGSAAGPHPYPMMVWHFAHAQIFQPTLEMYVCSQKTCVLYCASCVCCSLSSPVCCFPQTISVDAGLL